MASFPVSSAERGGGAIGEAKMKELIGAGFAGVIRGGGLKEGLEGFGGGTPLKSSLGSQFAG